jgi:hypothetical protein
MSPREFTSGRGRLTLLVVAALFSSPLLAVPDPLADQFGQLVSLAAFGQEPVLAIVASGRKIRHMEGWERGLREQYPDLVSVRVADIDDEPRPTYERVAVLLRDKAPPDVSVMIDLDNLWAEEYSLDTREPCLLLFNASGELVGEFRGRPNKKRIAEVLAALAEVLPADPPS